MSFVNINITSNMLVGSSNAHQPSSDYYPAASKKVLCLNLDGISSISNTRVTPMNPENEVNMFNIYMSNGDVWFITVELNKSKDRIEFEETVSRIEKKLNIYEEEK